MKKPTRLGTGELSSTICAMLLQQGKTEFSLSHDEFDNLDLVNCGLYCEGEYENEDDESPVSFTVKVLTVAEIEALNA